MEKTFRRSKNANISLIIGIGITKSHRKSNYLMGAQRTVILNAVLGFWCVQGSTTEKMKNDRSAVRVDHDRGVAGLGAGGHQQPEREDHGPQAEAGLEKTTDWGFEPDHYAITQGYFPRNLV